MLSCAPSAPSMEHSAVRADALARMRSQACMQRADAFAEACMRKHARSPALPPLQCALRPALLRSHVLRRQGHTEHAKFQFCEASRYDLRECSGNSALSREKLCFGNNARTGYATSRIETTRYGEAPRDFHMRVVQNLGIWGVHMPVAPLGGEICEMSWRHTSFVQF